MKDTLRIGGFCVSLSPTIAWDHGGASVLALYSSPLSIYNWLDLCRVLQKASISIEPL